MTEWVEDRRAMHAEPCLTDSMAYSTWRRRPSGDHTVTSVSYMFWNMIECYCCEEGGGDEAAGGGVVKDDGSWVPKASEGLDFGGQIHLIEWRLIE